MKTEIEKRCRGELTSLLGLGHHLLILLSVFLGLLCRLGRKITGKHKQGWKESGLVSMVSELLLHYL